ncbi:hypothetical protein TNCV_4555751 [Trichonephila clavipes]|nr:hypothetical protein TNCV_4555751 [Trichonephila clavipes]
MSERAFKETMVKFEKTRPIGVLSGRRQKRVNTTVVEGIVTSVVEASSESLHGTDSVPTISRSLDVLYCTVRQNGQRIFPNSLPSLITRSPALRLLITKLFER